MRSIGRHEYDGQSQREQHVLRVVGEPSLGRSTSKKTCQLNAIEVGSMKLNVHEDRGKLTPNTLDALTGLFRSASAVHPVPLADTSLRNLPVQVLVFYI